MTNVCLIDTSILLNDEIFLFFHHFLSSTAFIHQSLQISQISLIDWSSLTLVNIDQRHLCEIWDAHKKKTMLPNLILRRLS